MPEPKVFDMTIRQLIQRFPKGFAVSPEGRIYEVLETRRRPQDLPVLTSLGGYIAVVPPVLKVGDEFYGQDGQSVAQRLSVSEQADEIDKLIKLADTVEEDEILNKLYKSYSDKLDYVKNNLKIL